MRAGGKYIETLSNERRVETIDPPTSSSFSPTIWAGPTWASTEAPRSRLRRWTGSRDFLVLDYVPAGLELTDVTVGDQPEAKRVFDLDSIQLLQTIRLMRDSGSTMSSAPTMVA